MTESSFPKVELPLSDDDWKTVALPMGRGVIDRGGHPYRLTNLDSVSDTVTIEVATVDPPRNEAMLDGFVHRIDAAKTLSVPPVSTTTVYEIGLMYDPLKHADVGGPISLQVLPTPVSLEGNKSWLVLYRITRQPNVSLANSSWTEERPRVAPVISVSRESQLPVSGLVLVDTVGVVRTTGELFRANISDAGAITWTPIGGGGGSDFVNSTASIDAAVDEVQAATWDSIPGALVERGSDGVARVKGSTAHNENVLNLGTADARYSRPGHTHNGSDIVSRVPFEHVDGSNEAYSNTNLGSTWTSVAVNSTGFFGRYPSALKYKTNVRAWNLDPETVLGVTPVKYEDKQNGDTRVGVVADSYVSSLPEMVETDPETGEVEGWKYMLFGVAQQVALRHLNQRIKALEAENETLKFNQSEILAYLGLSTDANGRVITEGGA